MQHAGLRGGDIRLGRRRGQLIEVGLRLRHLRLPAGKAGLRAAFLQARKLGLRLSHRRLGLRQIVGIRMHQRVELLLGILHRRLGLRDISDLFLARGIIGYLRLGNGVLGRIKRRLGLHIGVVICLALCVIQLIWLLLTSRIGCAGLVRVGAGILHVLPVLLGRCELRLRLRKRVDTILECQLGVGLGLRGAVLRALQRRTRLIDLALRHADIGLGRVPQRIELGLRRGQVSLCALHIGDSAGLGLGQLRFGAIERRLRAGEILRGGAAIRRSGQLGLGRLEAGLGLLKLDLKIGRIDLGQRLPGLDLIAHLDIDRCDRAGLLKGQRDGARRRDRAAAGHRDREIALANRRRGGGGGWSQSRWQPPEQRGRDQQQDHRQQKPALALKARLLRTRTVAAAWKR